VKKKEREKKGKRGRGRMSLGCIFWHTMTERLT
jgi:hypothetical protein